MSNKNIIKIYVFFGIAFSVALFQTFGLFFFQRTEAGFDFMQMFFAAVWSGLFGKFSYFIGVKLLPSDEISQKKSTLFMQLLRDTLIIGLVPFCVGLFLTKMLGDHPLLFMFIVMANYTITPLIFAFITIFGSEPRLPRICLVALLAWIIFQLPLTIMQRQPLQIWFGSFLSLCIFSIFGYLIGQGILSIRRRKLAI